MWLDVIIVFKMIPTVLRGLSHYCLRLPNVSAIGTNLGRQLLCKYYFAGKDNFFTWLY
jgi:hypothetical protein